MKKQQGCGEAVLLIIIGLATVAFVLACIEHNKYVQEFAAHCAAKDGRVIAGKNFRTCVKKDSVIDI